MKNYTFKSLTILTVVMLFSFSLKAQVTLNAESGNIGVETGYCWEFSNMEYYEKNNISGDYSVLTTKNKGTCTISTPWMKLGSGNITFKTLPKKNTKISYIAISYIPYGGTKVQFETVRFVLDTRGNLPAYLFTSSIPIPTEIANSSTPYKIEFDFIVNNNGAMEVYTDDYSIPGTYFSDPLNNCLPQGLIEDADKDGIQNADDNYTNDATRAYNNYFPTENSFSTLAFEDTWPSKGDYDFNDVVVNYNINRVTNSENKVVELIGTFKLIASGAGFKNAFGFQLDGIAPDVISSVTGTNKDESIGLFNYMSNGLEANQQFANCIVFENFFHVMKHPGGGVGVNVVKGAPFVPYETITVHVLFDSQNLPTITDLSMSKINFYIVAKTEKGRGNEIHLVDGKPTSLVNNELFGKYDDNSNGAKYYRTKNNLPWGINILQGYDYTVERISIEKAHTKFIKWAESNGTQDQDWFMNKNGNRNPENIY